MRTIKEIVRKEIYRKINELIEKVKEEEEYKKNRINHINWEEMIEENIEELEESYGEVEKIEIEELKGRIEEDKEIETDEYEYEVMGYYEVSKWLYENLKELGYPVSKYRGIHVMERITAGQEIEKDYIMKQVQRRKV